MKKLYIILLSSICVSLLPLRETNAELNCTATPDCAELGYTMTTSDCKNLQMAVCPTDSTKVFCKKPLTEASSGSSTAKTISPVTCAVGTIIGGNGSCYATELPEGVLPVGVVFDTSNRLAVAITDIKADGTPGREYVVWATVEKYDTAIADCQYDSETLSPDSCATDGRANTDVMLKATGGGTYEAAQAVNKYEPEGCTAPFCKKTKWFIPSLKEWRTLYKQNTKVEMGLALVVPDKWAMLTGTNTRHSSNESDRGYTYRFDPGCASISETRKTSKEYLRPIVKY